MKRLFVLTTVLWLAGGVLALAGQSRTYDKTLESTWDAAVKAVRDVNFVVVDSDRAAYEFTMRNKSKLSHKKGINMQVTLNADGQTVTVVAVEVVDPSKAAKAAKHMTSYLDALDGRLK